MEERAAQGQARDKRAQGDGKLLRRRRGNFTNKKGKSKSRYGIILNLKKIQCFRPRAPSVLSTVSAAPAVIMKGNGRQEDDEEEEETAFPFPPTAASDGVRYQHHLPPPSPHPARRNASGASLVAMASLNLVRDSPMRKRRIEKSYCLFLSGFQASLRLYDLPGPPAAEGGRRRLRGHSNQEEEGLPGAAAQVALGVRQSRRCGVVNLI